MNDRRQVRKLCGDKKRQTERSREIVFNRTLKRKYLAVTQVDHYLLLHKCDVVEKVKLIVWKWAEPAGLILYQHHHCTMADSSFRHQGVLPWCSLEQIDMLVLLLRREDCVHEAIKNTLPTLYLSVKCLRPSRKMFALFVSISLIYWCCSVNTLSGHFTCFLNLYPISLVAIDLQYSLNGALFQVLTKTK